MKSQTQRINSPDFTGKSKEWKAGYDAGSNGPDAQNSHHSNFATREGMKDWQDGNNQGKKLGRKKKPVKHNPRKK